MRQNPVYGKGVSFPFRVESTTGAVSTSIGSSDSVSVALAYLSQEAWTIREEVFPEQNLVAEAIANILLTREGEHDTLPEYGGDINSFIFDNSSYETRFLLDVYFRQAVKRWEKRAFLSENSIIFSQTQTQHRYGEFPVEVDISFAMKQPKGNLVAPYTTTVEARTAEYPADSFDPSRHDYCSRYYNNPTAIDGSNNVSFNKLSRQRDIPKAADDYLYKTKYLDSWLSISWSEYADIRYWDIIANSYLQDCAEEGLSSDFMYPSFEMEIGTQIRLPSRQRVLMQLSIDRFAGQ